VNNDGTGIYSLNKQPKKVGEIRPREGLIIKTRRDRGHHIAVVSAKEVIERIAGTTGKDGIVKFVESLIT